MCRGSFLLAASSRSVTFAYLFMFLEHAFLYFFSDMIYRIDQICPCSLYIQRSKRREKKVQDAAETVQKAREAGETIQKTNKAIPKGFGR